MTGFVGVKTAEESLDKIIHDGWAPRTRFTIMLTPHGRSLSTEDTFCLLGIWVSGVMLHKATLYTAQLAHQLSGIIDRKRMKTIWRIYFQGRFFKKYEKF